jgi:nitroreductase
VNVSDAVAQRFSARAFTQDPVPAEVVREILDAARRAPSGGNLQPWRVYVLGGEPLATFKNLIAENFGNRVCEVPEYKVYPPSLWEPLRTRRHETGTLRYRALGAADKDPAGNEALLRMNYEFFGAPLGLFFCLDRRCGPPQWSDLGMYMLSVMLLAVERGLDTCSQEIWSNWPKAVAHFLDLPQELMLFAGMSMGYRDAAHPLNQYRTPRAALADIAQFRGL